MLVVPRGIRNQYVAGVAASSIVFVSGSCYGWITPLLTSLLTPQGVIPLSKAAAPWVVSVMEIANIVSPIPAGIVTNYIGRKPLLLAAAPVYVVGWLMIIFYRTPLMLAIARIIQGTAMGFACTLAPVYLGEISSDASRGALSSLNCNAWWLSLLVQYLAGSMLNFTDYTIFTLVLNVPCFLLLFFQPESPYYHMMAGDVERAEKSLRHFRDSGDDELKAELEEIRLSVSSDNRSARLSDLFATPADRYALHVFMVISVVRILSGAGAIIIWADKMFDMTPNLSLSSALVTIILGVVMLVGGVFSSFTSDTLGRRPLLMISTVGTLLFQTITSVFYFLLFETSVHVTSFSWIAPVCICLYMALCSAGLYPVASAYTSELFPTKTRGVASCLANIVTAICTFIGMFFFPILTEYLGLYTNFVMYSLVSLYGTIYLYFYAPETKGKSFVQIRKDLLGG